MVLPIALAWGFAEATFFFVVPDVAIGLAALFSWRGGAVATAGATVGALLGGTAVFAAPDYFLRRFPALPGITPKLIADVERRVRRAGVASLFQGPVLGLPYKVYAAHLALAKAPYLSFLVVSVPARLARFVLVLAGAGLVGAALRRWIRPHRRLVSAIYALGWALWYRAYFRRMAARNGGPV
jgi:membrane protein YqaA with SNARE-associated domain